jgi:two-component system, chemotaxis family, protein-glutamate methylesterase/glutaminase
MKYKAVVIGVSSGGLNALKIIIPALPAQFPLAVIIVQHIGATSDSYWIRALNKLSSVNVKEAEEKEIIRKGFVYVAPPNYHLLVEKDETFTLTIDERVNFARPAIDVLFESAADAYREKLIGIVLTGANNDGAAGLKKIKENGGLAIAQNPATAESPYMPASAIRTAHPHHIFSLHEIPQRLIELAAQSI